MWKVAIYLWRLIKWYWLDKWDRGGCTAAVWRCASRGRKDCICRYVDHQRDMGVVLGERDIRREIMKHRGRFVKSLEMWNFVAKPPLRGKCVEVVSALPIVDTFYLFWPRVAEKPTNDFFKMKDTTFPISHLQQLFSFDKKNFSPTTGLWSKWRANREAGFYLPEQNKNSNYDFMVTRPQMLNWYKRKWEKS